MFGSVVSVLVPINTETSVCGIPDCADCGAAWQPLCPLLETSQQQDGWTATGQVQKEPRDAVVDVGL